MVATGDLRSSPVLIVSSVPTTLAQLLAFGVGFTLTAWIAKAMLQTRQLFRHRSARHPEPATLGNAARYPATMPATGLPVR